MAGTWVSDWVAQAIAKSARADTEGKVFEERVGLGDTAEEIQQQLIDVLGEVPESGSFGQQLGKVLKEKVLPVAAGYIAGGPIGAIAADLAVIGKEVSRQGGSAADWGTALATVGSIAGDIAAAGETPVEPAAIETGGADVAWYDEIGEWITGGQGIVPDILESAIQTGIGYLGQAIFGSDGAPSPSGGQASAYAGLSPNVASYLQNVGNLEATGMPSVSQPIPSGVSAAGNLVYQPAAGRRMIPYQQGVWPGPGYKLVNRKAVKPTAGHAAGMYWVPRRQVNPLNPRALARASRRSEGFMGYVRKHFTFPGRVAKPKSPFRARRRRSRK